MTAIGKAVQLVISDLASNTGSTSKAPVPCEPPPPGGYQPPELPADVQQQVDQLAGNVRFKSNDGTADFVMSGGEPTYHPEAAGLAHAMRLALQPADPGTIEAWILMLADGLVPADPGEFVGRLRAIQDLCGDLPVACWTKATRREALDAFDFLPTAKKLNALLRPHADRMQRELRALERMADAERRPAPGPAREAKGYDPGPATPERPSRRAVLERDPAADLVRIDPARVEALLTALGYPRDSAARAALGATGCVVQGPHLKNT